MEKHFCIGKIFSCTRGIAALEFAIALPFMMALMLGCFELTRYVIMEEKLEKITYTIADVITQSDTITIAQIDETMGSASVIMQPSNFPLNGLAIVTSVYQNVGGAPTIRWQHSGGGTLARASKVGLVGANAVLPNGLTLNDKDNVIITEVFYNYKPLVTGGLFAGNVDIYKVVIFKPRLGALTTPPV